MNRKQKFEIEFRELENLSLIDVIKVDVIEDELESVIKEHVNKSLSEYESIYWEVQKVKYITETVDRGIIRN